MRTSIGSVSCLALAFALPACQQPNVEARAGADAAAASGGHGGTPAPQGMSDAAFVLPDVAGFDTSSAALDASCAADVYRADAVPVDLVFVIDQSPSMLFTIGDRTKWQLAREALLGFLADPRSSGLGVGLQFFPIPSARAPCANDEACGIPFACKGGTCSNYPFNPFPSCAAFDYRTLTVPIEDLPASRATLEGVVRRREPYENIGVSAIGVAADGVFAHLRARLAAKPGRRSAVVLVTDGVPSGCFYGWADAAAIERGLAAEAARTPAIPTFVIGVLSENKQEDAQGPDALARFAVAGGTREPFIVKPPDDVTRKFQDALDRIREASLPCEYLIPAPTKGELDFGKVNLHVRDAAGERDLVHVGSRERCDATRGGWYYDVAAAANVRPTRVIACDATCRALRTESKAELSLTFGCQTRIVE